MARALVLSASFALAANACHDVNGFETDPGYQKCYRNILWAKTTGIVTHPEYYVNETLTVNSSIQKFQQALHDNVGIKDGIAANGEQGWGCPKPCTLGAAQGTDEKASEAKSTCYDVSASETAPQYQECKRNLLWAKSTGIKTNPQYYVNYTIDENCSLTDFQYVLFTMTEPGDLSGAKGHSCPEPCTKFVGSTYVAAAPPVSRDVSLGTEVTSSRKTSGSPGMPWYTWVLIIIGVLCCCPIILIACASFICYESVAFILDPFFGDKKPKKKKRGLKNQQKENADEQEDRLLAS